MTDTKWSKYQEAIFDWVVNGSGNAIVPATAGSGKTTTLVHIATLLPRGSAIFVAFNRHIVLTLNEKLEGSGATAVTMNSAGNRAVQAWGRTLGFDEMKLKDDKYFKIVRDLIDKTSPFKSLNKREKYEAQKVILDLVEMACNTLVPPNDEGFDIIRRKQSIEIPTLIVTSPASYANSIFEYKGFLEDEAAAADAHEMDDSGQHDPYNEDDDEEDEIIPNTAFYELAREVMKTAMMMTEKEGIIDYIDQVYLPVIKNLPIKQFDWVLCDESQDFSNVQRALLLMMVKKGGRVIAVGDSHQAIMGFTGAATDSMEQFKRVLKATELPLSICYRLPVLHIEMARVYDPLMEARPNAPDGSIIWSTTDTFMNVAERGDLIMCRRTAPLVTACIRFIANGIPAKVRGKKIGEGLITLIDKIAAMKGFDMARFVAFKDDYFQTQIRRLGRDEGNESQIATLEDKAMAIQACWQRYSTSTDNLNMRDFTDGIDAMFADDKANPPIWLSTVHRAKGLEANRALVLDYHRMPFTWTNITEEQYKQERNITFVALTRGKDQLVLVTETKDQWPSDAKEAKPASVVPIPPLTAFLPKNMSALSAPSGKGKSAIKAEDIDWATDPFWMSATVTSTPGESQTVIVQKKQEPPTSEGKKTVEFDSEYRAQPRTFVSSDDPPILDGMMSVNSQGADEIIKQSKMYQRMSEISRDLEREKKQEEKLIEDIDHHVQNHLDQALKKDSEANLKTLKNMELDFDED